MPSKFLARLRNVFDGDPGVRKVAGDPTLMAELLLLFRMILADGAVSKSELDAFSRICRDAFQIREQSIEGVIRYLQEFGFETSAPESLAMFRSLPMTRRQLLVEHLTEVAKADRELNEIETRLLTRTVEVLGLNLVETTNPPNHPVILEAPAQSA